MAMFAHPHPDQRDDHTVHHQRQISRLPVAAADQASAHAHNLGKLAQLLPATAQQLQAAFTPGDPACQPTWARVRVASHDRLPIIGPVPGPDAGLFALTALGARGITLAALDRKSVV